MSSDRTDTDRQSDVGTEGRKEETVREAPSGKVPPRPTEPNNPCLVSSLTRGDDGQARRSLKHMASQHLEE